MSKIKKRLRSVIVVLGLLSLVVIDLWDTDRTPAVRSFFPEGVVASPGAMSVVSIVASDDADLSNPAPITVSPEYVDDPHSDMNARLNKEQIEEMVYKALNLDQSSRSIREVVQPGDWVVLKPNIVTCPDGEGIHTAYGQQSWSRGTNRGQDHWGQNTDLRVVRAVLKYLIEVDGDASRITIAEGGAEWHKLGESNTDPNQEHDGWTVHWEPFDSLSYVDIVNEFQDNENGIIVDIVDLNYDDYVDKDGVVYPWTEHSPSGDPIPVPDPNGTGVTWFQRPEGFYVSRTLLECDKLINIPAMKTHDIPGETTIFKQYVGTYMQNAYGGGWGKGGLHVFGNDKVPNGFMDLYSYRPTDYAVVEGIWGVEGNGPQTGDDVKLNVIVAGGDPVATEAVTAQIMGFNPYDIYHLHLAAAKGFGTWDMNQIEVVGRSIQEVRRPFRKPSSWATGPMGIVRWLVNGPYEGTSIDPDYLNGEAGITPEEGDVSNGHVWEVAECNLRDDRSTLSLGGGSGVINYAFTWIKSDSQRSVYLFAKGDDELKVWLNGEILNESGKSSLIKLITLNEGWNALLVKVLNTVGESSVEVKLQDNDRNTPMGIQYLLVNTSRVVEGDKLLKPLSFKLSQNYPNPFPRTPGRKGNPTTWIYFELAQPGHVTLTVYNVIGQKVRTLVDKNLPAGVNYSVWWNGKDDLGRNVGSGIYLYRLTSNGRTLTRKMMLLR